MSRRGTRPTAKDVAEAAGVAPMTVSYAFSKPERVAAATRQRVLEAAEALGYRPHSTARALRSGRNEQLGVVIGEHLSYAFTDPQAAQFLAGVADVCVEHDRGMVLIPTHGSGADEPGLASGEDPDVERVLAAPVDGYVLWTTTRDDPVLTAIAASGRPAAIQGGPRHESITFVGSDDTAAAEAVAIHALATAAPPEAGLDDPGARPRAAVISFPLDHAREAMTLRGSDLPSDLDTIPFPVTAARLAGYRAALTEHGLDWASTAIVTVRQNRRRDGLDACRRLLETLEPAPAVLLTMSDELALGARSALPPHAPDTVVTGWDGSAEGQDAGLMSVTNSLREQGRRCALAALEPALGDQRLPWAILDGRRPTAPRTPPAHDS